MLKLGVFEKYLKYLQVILGSLILILILVLGLFGNSDTVLKYIFPVLAHLCSAPKQPIVPKFCSKHADVKIYRNAVQITGKMSIALDEREEKLKGIAA